MRENELSDVKRIETADGHPDGEFEGVWSGYVVRRSGYQCPVHCDGNQRAILSQSEIAAARKFVRITIEVTGLRPATLGSEFKQRPQLRVHRFVMPLCCRAMDTQTLYVE
jgi:hypothetical protein